MIAAIAAYTGTLSGSTLVARGHETGNATSAKPIASARTSQVGPALTMGQLTPTAAPLDLASVAHDGPSLTADYSSVDSVTWKVLVIVYRQIDLELKQPDGSRNHLRATMTDEMYDLVMHTVEQVEPAVRNWSHGLADWSLTVVDAAQPLGEVEQLDDGYWVSPKAIRADLDRYAPAGRYDSVVVVWQPTDDHGGKIPVPAWGLTLPPGPWANGAGFSSITTPSSVGSWTESADPEEVFVHEWMHQVIFFHDIPVDLDAGGSYGYSAADGSWQSFLSDVMTGQVQQGDDLLGVDSETWRAGTPTQPQGLVALDR